MSAKPTKEAIEAATPSIQRLLPQSSEAEFAILCGLTISPREVGAICAQRKIQRGHFHIPAHAELFDVLTTLWKENVAPEFQAIAAMLRDRHQFAEVGGAPKIMELTTTMATAVNIHHYLGIVQEKHILREIVRVGHSYHEKAHFEQDKASELLDGFVSEVNQLIVPKNTKVRSMKELAMSKLNRMAHSTDDTRTILTGIKKLDYYSPLKRGSMPLISGERKSGKSMLAMTIAMNVALDGHRVLYFSLEDKADELVDRMFARQARVPIVLHSSKALEANGKDGESTRLRVAASDIAKLPILIRDDVFERNEVIAVARQYKAQFPDFSVAVLDYAQLVKSFVSKNANREQEVAAVSRDCRIAAMELDVAFIVLCQLNADGNTRESTALEKDCTAMWKVNTPGEKEDQNKRLITIPFQRNGEGNVGFNTTFLGHLASFENYSGPGPEEPEPEDKPKKKHK